MNKVVTFPIEKTIYLETFWCMREGDHTISISLPLGVYIKLCESVWDVASRSLHPLSGTRAVHVRTLDN